MQMDRRGNCTSHPAPKMVSHWCTIIITLSSLNLFNEEFKGLVHMAENLTYMKESEYMITLCTQRVVCLMMCVPPLSYL